MQVHPPRFRGQSLRAALLAVLALPAIYLIAAVLGGAVASLPASNSNTRPHAIYLAKGPIHYDFVLPLDARVRAAFGNLVPQNAAARHLIVGYGGRHSTPPSATIPT
ncbi:hypothetical protein KDD17_15950 [Sulfitobacter albidus]|uniref:Uncharacterized protein n=1 Tax=Sulfitobacter albidus TaxID=2829501 RepID=A0A975JD97_9RHOB|nr:hypothetical protein [Sulfitobacter albidus]QUJ76364.1 hypothetical protein KDD17_15950 [Sulfitobacter albidus]